MTDKSNDTIPETLHKVGVQWLAYVEANDVPKKGTTRERIAHAFAAGAYIAGGLHDGAMFMVGVRGSHALEEWARKTPVPVKPASKLGPDLTA